MPLDILLHKMRLKVLYPKKSAGVALTWFIKYIGFSQTNVSTIVIISSLHDKG